MEVREKEGERKGEQREKREGRGQEEKEEKERERRGKRRRRRVGRKEGKRRNGEIEEGEVFVKSYVVEYIFMSSVSDHAPTYQLFQEI